MAYPNTSTTPPWQYRDDQFATLASYLQGLGHEVDTSEHLIDVYFGKTLVPGDHLYYAYRAAIYPPEDNVALSIGFYLWATRRLATPPATIADANEGEWVPFKKDALIDLPHFREQWLLIERALLVLI